MTCVITNTLVKISHTEGSNSSIQQNYITSRHMQHSSCPESGLHLCFPSRRLSRHTLQTSQWKDLSLWILSKRLKLVGGSRICYFYSRTFGSRLFHTTQTGQNDRNQRLIQISEGCQGCCFPIRRNKRLLCSKVRF